MVTDGSTNSVHFCIRKCKSNDEGKYTVTAYNSHGEDTVVLSLFVAAEGGMDFRAMLQRRQYGKWGKDKEDPDWQLKEREKEEEMAKLLKKVRMAICVLFVGGLGGGDHRILTGQLILRGQRMVRARSSLVKPQT